MSFLIAISIALLFLLIAAGFLFLRMRSHAKLLLAASQKESSRRMYELAILKELGERIGYSLDVQNIVDIITGSLHQLIEYSAVSYMLLEPEKILFKVHLEQSVSRQFIDDIETRMLGSLGALLGREFKKEQVAEVLSGAVLIEDIAEPVRSFFNIPLVIGEKVMGVITVADIKPGLYKEDEMTVLYKITQQASRTVTKLKEVVDFEERKYSAMIESMTEGVVMTDTEYRIVAANPAIKKPLGLAEKKEVTIFDFIDHLDGKFDIRGRLEESIKLDRVLETPEVLINDRFFRIVVAPVKSSRGIEADEVMGGVAIFQDITHDKELEKLREDFTAMMVHELRSPLVGIKSVVDYMEGKNGQPDEKEAEHVRLVRDASSRMLDLVNDLLDVAKIQAGKFEIAKAPSDLKAIIGEKVAFYDSLAKEQGIGLRSMIDSHLPALISFDPTRIAQVLNNLISNALKFTPSGGAVIVQALSHQTGQDVLAEAKNSAIDWMLDGEDAALIGASGALIVAVTDTGPGIPKDKIPELFSKFKQFQFGTTAEKKGTGLGLVIAKGLVEAHGGTIGIASREGQGTTFYFTIPLS
jgi:PAS domain S-box-containing protein